MLLHNIYDTCLTFTSSLHLLKCVIFYSEFGSKVINVKPLIKKIPSFLEDRDKMVREEGKALVIEMYRYVEKLIVFNILRILL